MPKKPRAFLIFLQATDGRKDSWSSFAQRPAGGGIRAGNGKPEFGFSRGHLRTLAARGCRAEGIRVDKSEREGGRQRRGVLPHGHVLQRGMGMPSSKDFYACRVGEKALLCISFRELIKLPSMYFRWLWPTVSVWHSSMTAWGWFLVDLPPVCCPLSSRDGFVAAGGGGGGELDAGRSGELT